MLKDSEGMSPLHFCCINNSLSVAEVLIEYGADINQVDKERLTPLHQVIKHYNGNVACSDTIGLGMKESITSLYVCCVIAYLI